MANIIPIQTIHDEKCNLFTSYSEAQLLHYYEPYGGLFIAESPKVIERALALGCEPVAFLMEEKHVTTQCAHILEPFDNVPVYVAPYEELVQLTGFALTRGALCAMKRPPLQDISSICKQASRIVILEDVTNPTNVGAIFRNAAALHMDAVILTNNCSDPFYRRAARVSMGTVFQIPWTYFSKQEYNDSTSYIPLLHQLGFETVSLALKDDSIAITDERLKQADKLAIILGNEGNGLCETTLNLCDYTAMIPMSHGVDSLNVAAASALAFWEMQKNS